MKQQNLQIITFCALFIGYFNSYSQDSTTVQNPNTTRSEFWEKVHFGGGFGLSFGNSTNITLAPSAIYDANKYFSFGAGIQGSYVSYQNYYKSYLYGGSLIGLINPIEQIQLSVDLEQLRVNNTIDNFPNTINKNFWNTALFFGIGYRSNNFTIGIRYNVLYKDNDFVYGQALMPFVRVYF